MNIKQNVWIAVTMKLPVDVFTFYLLNNKSEGMNLLWQKLCLCFLTNVSQQHWMWMGFATRLLGDNPLTYVNSVSPNLPEWKSKTAKFTLWHTMKARGRRDLELQFFLLLATWLFTEHVKNKKLITIIIIIITLVIILWRVFTIICPKQKGSG